MRVQSMALAACLYCSCLPASAIGTGTLGAGDAFCSSNNVCSSDGGHAPDLVINIAIVSAIVAVVGVAIYQRASADD